MARTYHGDARPAGVTVLSVVWFVMAVLNVLLGAGATLAGYGAFDMLVGIAGTLTGGFLAAFGAAVLVVGLLQLVIGWGLWTLRGWARTAAIAFALIGLLSFPVGTLLGIVVLVYLFQDEVREAFEPGAERAGRPTTVRRRV